MSEADQLLATQASQTANLMQAIGQNTQRAFDNQFRVQAAQMSTGLQVAGQIEQYRMNDARLNELGQVMRIRDQEHQWEKANQAFTEKLRPLEFQAKQYDLQNKFRIQAEQRMSPFLTDIKGEFQQLIMERPELAADAQALYATSIDGILNNTMSNPNSDVSTLLQSKKDDMRKWIEKSRAVPEGPSPKIGGLLGAGIDAANKMLGTSFDPLASFKAKSGSTSLSSDQASRAASIYAGTFGGVPQDFLRKHDQTYKDSNDAEFRVHMTTGKMPSAEAYARFTPQQQAAIDDQVKKSQSLSSYNSASENIVEQIKALTTQDKDLINANQPPVNAETISGLVAQLGSINAERAKVMGYNVNTDPNKTAVPAASNLPTKDEIIRSIPTGAQPATSTTQSTALKDMLSSNFSNVESIIRDVSTVDNDELQSLKNKYISNPDSVSRADIQKLISKATPDRIESLAGADWFRKHIEDNNLDVTYDPNSEYVEQSKTARAIQVLTTQSRPLREDYLSSSPKRFFSSERDRLWTDKEKEDARKVLKSELPNILFDYLNQNR